MKPLNLLLSAMTLLFMGLGSAQAQTALTEAEASKVVKIQNLNATPARISGVIANASAHTVKDVQLLIQYHWLWNNEWNPGQNPPGRAVTVNLDKELKPGETMPFSYKPMPPLPERKDGRFIPEVDVGGFTTVIPQRMATRSNG